MAQKDSQAEDRQFAFGTNSYQGCDCPTLRAGYQPERMETVIQEYDRLMASKQSVEAGIVDEETAKEVWLQMIWVMGDCEVAFARPVKEPLEHASRVARKLGWLEGQQ